MKYLFELLLGRVPAIVHFPSWFVMSLLPSWKVTFLIYIKSFFHLATPMSSCLFFIILITWMLSCTYLWPFMTSLHISSTSNGAFVGWPLHNDIFVELNQLSTPYYLQGLRRCQGSFDLLYMLDLFLHLIILGLISQPPYTLYEITSSCWTLLHCSTFLWAYRWRKRSFYSWSWF